ncbi:MAG: hypothetical protein ABFC62_01940 [Clostridiaceae bacterium]
MKEHRIGLSELMPCGKTETRLEDGMLEAWTTHSITSIAFNLYGDSYRKHILSLPGRYRLPFRVDMTIRLDFPALLLLIGGGHISFATPWQDNRRIEDIVKPSGKPNQDGGAFDNSLPFGELVDVSVTYNLDEMQIHVGGEERFYSRKQAYMKAKDIGEQNAEGFAIALTVSKLSTLCVKRIAVTEFDGRAPIVRGEYAESKPSSAEGERQKPTFESVLSALPRELRGEIMETDRFLISLRPLKFKRAVDKGGKKVSYVAPEFGVSYAIHASGAQSSHDLGFYIVCGGKVETWHRKADFMEEALAETAKTDPALAERIFYALNDCVGCYGGACLAKTPYAFEAEKRMTCHGRSRLRMCSDDLRDAREFFRHLNALTERKIAAGEPTAGKILLIKSDDEVKV